jgi:Ca2+-binding RTX toxin-like protein
MPPPARASTVSTNSFAPQVWISYTADPGEENDLSISRDSDGYVVVDPGARPLRVSGDCRLLPPAPGETVSSSARCPAAGVYQVVISLNDGQEDHLAIADSAYPPEQPPLGAFPIDADGGPGKDVLAGGPGRDQLKGSSGDDEINGGSGQDRLQGDAGVDHINGEGDDDEVSGGDGNDVLDGGAGDDNVRGGDGDDQASGGAGNDRLDFGLAGFVDDYTHGQDILDGGPGDDQVDGGPPGDKEHDVLGGGDGSDTADYGRRTAALDVSLDGQSDDGESGEKDNVQADVENVIGGSNDDTLTGSAAPNRLEGHGGDDTIDGRAGDDALVGGVNDPGGDNLGGGAGNDTMSGGPGDDQLAGGDGDDAASGGGGTDIVEGEDGADSLTGGAGGDTVNGEDGNDTLYGGEVALVGGDGADDLKGGAGEDRLYGGRGNDQLDGGLGPDYISGDAEKDTVSYEDRTSSVIVTLDGQANDGEAGENDNVLPNVESVVGGRRGDDLYGDHDGNTVNGGDGEDLLIGDAGVDQLLGGDAPDVVEARDGVADEVTCGNGEDLAIVDAKDKVDCETKDAPGARRLSVGRHALLRSQGPFALRLPGGRRFFPLAGSVKIPIGATVDPQDGVVRVVTARNRSGARQAALVSAGRFTIRQRGDQRPITELRLAGAFPSCTGSSTGRAVAKRRPPRKLDVDIGRNKRPRRRYEVRGSYSIGGAQGTAWVTEDRCDGTLTTVRSGTVRVLSLQRKTLKIVKAGQSYLARAS